MSATSSSLAVVSKCDVVAVVVVVVVVVALSFKSVTSTDVGFSSSGADVTSAE